MIYKPLKEVIIDYIYEDQRGHLVMVENNGNKFIIEQPAFKQLIEIIKENI